MKRVMIHHRWGFKNMSEVYDLSSTSSGKRKFVWNLKLKIYRAENVLLLDGENLIANPNEEWSRLLEFLGLEKDSLKFYHDKEKGFPCLESPLKYCLNGAKGISRKEDVRQIYPKETAIWQEAFSPEIKELISYMKICDKIDRKCCRKLKKEASSFSWAYEYACWIFISAFIYFYTNKTIN